MIYEICFHLNISRNVQRIDTFVSWFITSDNTDTSPASLGLSAMSMEVIQSRCKNCLRFTKKFLNIDVWKNKGYVIWALSNGVSLFGYFVPFVHIVSCTSISNIPCTFALLLMLQ